MITQTTATRQNIKRKTPKINDVIFRNNFPLFSFVELKSTHGFESCYRNSKTIGRNQF